MIPEVIALWFNYMFPLLIQDNFHPEKTVINEFYLNTNPESVICGNKSGNTEFKATIVRPVNTFLDATHSQLSQLQQLTGNIRNAIEDYDLFCSQLQTAEEITAGPSGAVTEKSPRCFQYISVKDIAYQHSFKGWEVQALKLNFNAQIRPWYTKAFHSSISLPLDQLCSKNSSPPYTEMFDIFTQLFHHIQISCIQHTLLSQ